MTSSVGMVPIREVPMPTGEPDRGCGEAIIDCFREVLEISEEQNIEVMLPEDLPLDVIERLIPSYILTVRNQGSLVEVEGDYIFVGDLHGSLADMIRIIRNFGMPPVARYLFLGDLVDRGRQSVQVTALALAMCVCWPASVHILRGNHEFSHMNRVYGFHEEIMSRYGSERLWESFQHAFAFFPLAATVNGAIFCVHGGLSPCVHVLEDIRQIRQPVIHYLGAQAISDLVWSDPSDPARGFIKNSRGCGQVFGRDVTEEFLRNNRLKVLIRAHQVSTQGFHLFAGFMGVSVFSASNYSQGINRAGCVACVGQEMTFYSYDPSGERVFLPRARMRLSEDIGLRPIGMPRVWSRPELRACASRGSSDALWMTGDDDEGPGLRRSSTALSALSQFG